MLGPPARLRAAPSETRDDRAQADHILDREDVQTGIASGGLGSYRPHAVCPAGSLRSKPRAASRAFSELVEMGYSLSRLRCTIIGRRDTTQNAMMMGIAPRATAEQSIELARTQSTQLSP